MIRALVDTGCTTTIADPRIVSTMSKNNEHIIAVDGSEVMCSVWRLRLSIAGHDVNTQCLVLSSMLEQFKLVIGMDNIQQLGGVTITTRCTRGDASSFFLYLQNVCVCIKRNFL